MDNIKNLLNKREKLISNFNCLLYDYRELKSFYKKGETVQDAEMNYYSYLYNLSGYDSEGLFSLEFRSTLKSEIAQNKKERNEICKQIHEIKKQIKLLMK
jgi:hypothetical protein